MEGLIIIQSAGRERRFGFSFVAATLLILARVVSAQVASAPPKTPLNNSSGNDTSIAKSEADRVRNERVANARALLISLASDAASFRDQGLRARSLARIADTLWEVDAEQSRTLFRKSWDAAVTADKESKEPLNLRRLVLSAIAKRDRSLAEELLQKMKLDLEATTTENSKPSLWALPEALEQRLDVAGSLLRGGDVERALQFADPALVRVTISTIDFLTQLRAKDPAAADQRYAALLANSGSNLVADANTISLLSSYIFTPETYAVFNIQGGADTSWMATPPPPANVSPQLRALFFQVAMSVLMRPQPPPEEDQTTAGVAGKYMVIRRLMPIFDQYAPREIATALHNQFEVLSAQVSADLRKTDSESLNKGIGREKSLSDQEEPLLDRIEKAKTSAERDDLYFRLALLALSKDDEKATKYISDIEDSDFRKRAQSWIDWSFAVNAVRNKQAEKALKYARKGELTHLQRLWVLTQCAKLLAKTDHDKAMTAIDEAIAESRRLEGAELDRPRGLLAIANSVNTVDQARLWDAMFEAVKAANSATGFGGEGGAFNFSINARSQIMSFREPVPDFDVRGIFAEAAKLDYERAVELARGFQGEAPRANATIAIARAVLSEKSAAPTPK